MGPSARHEERVQTLLGLALVSGFDRRMPPRYWAYGQPDVARCSSRGAIFLGDGKATETPGNRATLTRLSRYSDFLVRWHACTKCPVMLCVAFTRPQDADRWQEAASRLSMFENGAQRLLVPLDRDERILALLSGGHATPLLRETTR